MSEDKLPDRRDQPPIYQIVVGLFSLLLRHVMQRTLASRITRSEVAPQLGIAVRDVKKAPTMAGQDTPPHGDSAI